VTTTAFIGSNPSLVRYADFTDMWNSYPHGYTYTHGQPHTYEAIS
jgi:hypothetical protein